MPVFSLRCSLSIRSPTASPAPGVAILHLLHAGGNSAVRGDVIFQKELFLIGDYIERIGDDADFFPRVFGPYSESAGVAPDELVSRALPGDRKGAIPSLPMGQPDAELRFLCTHKRSAVLGIVSGNPQFIRGVQEIGNPGVINGICRTAVMREAWLRST